MFLQPWLNSLRGAHCALLTALVTTALCSPSYAATLLLNDTWADGDRTSVNLPTNSPTWIGQTAGNGSNSVSPGSLNFALPTNSLKVWTYFTDNNSAPDGNQPHNQVTMLTAGQALSAEASFSLPDGATATSTSRNFRMGLFFDPTDARVQADVNSDGGGGTAPWTDALGYVVQLPLNSSSSGSNPLQIGKRTTSNSSLAGSGGAYTFAPTGGAVYSLSANTVYTLQLFLLVHSSQVDVTATLKQGSTVLSTLTVPDLGTSFGAVAIPGGLLPGSQGLYTKFDQLFLRNSDSTQVNPQPNGNLRFTNFRVEIAIPEPTSLVLLGLAALGLAFARRTR
jgi:PEP-CTERM motif